MTFRRMVGIGFATAVIAGALPLSACGGGGGGDDDNSALSGIQTDVGTKTAREVVEQVIQVKDNEFSPSSVTIKAGTKVIWQWTGTSNAHSIQLSGATSPEQTSGSFERTFDQTGNSFAYQCGVHKEAMTGRIVIE